MLISADFFIGKHFMRFFPPTVHKILHEFFFRSNFIALHMLDPYTLRIVDSWIVREKSEIVHGLFYLVFVSIFMMKYIFIFLPTK